MDKRKKKGSKLKIILKFAENVSEEQEVAVWSKVLDILNVFGNNWKT